MFALQVGQRHTSAARCVASSSTCTSASLLSIRFALRLCCNGRLVGLLQTGPIVLHKKLHVYNFWALDLLGLSGPLFQSQLPAGRSRGLALAGGPRRRRCLHGGVTAPKVADTPPEERGRISRPNCHRLLGIVSFIAILDSFPWSSIVLYGNFGLQRAGPETSFSSYMPLASISGSHIF